MRKWTYLVAALLMGGATATFTGCIDTDEPAGINELRGAKAELLRAKAEYQSALAQTELMRAEEQNIKNQQEQVELSIKQLELALKEAENQWKMDSLQARRDTLAASLEIMLVKFQEKKAQADYDLQKAMEKIDAALITMKDDIYAQQISYYRALLDGGDYINENGTLVPIVGNGARVDLNTAEEELFKLQLQRAQYVGKNTYFQANLEAELASQEKTLEIQQGLRDALDELEGADVSTLNAQKAAKQNEQQALDQKEADAIQNLENMRAELEPTTESIAALDVQKQAKKTYTIAVSDIANPSMYGILRTALDNFSYSNVDETDLSYVFEQNTMTGEYTMKNDYTLSGDGYFLSNEATILSQLGNEIMQGYQNEFVSAYNALFSSSENASDLFNNDGSLKDNVLVKVNNELSRLEIDLPNIKATAQADSTAWVDAYAAYQAALVAYGDYRGTSTRNAVVEQIVTYNDLPSTTTAAAKAASAEALRQAIIAYIDKREAVDGYVFSTDFRETYDEAFTAATDLTNFNSEMNNYESDPNTYLGTDVISTTVTDLNNAAEENLLANFLKATNTLLGTNVTSLSDAVQPEAYQDGNTTKYRMPAGYETTGGTYGNYLSASEAEDIFTDIDEWIALYQGIEADRKESADAVADINAQIDELQIGAIDQYSALWAAEVECYLIKGTNSTRTNDIWSTNNPYRSIYTSGGSGSTILSEYAAIQQEINYIDSAIMGGGTFSYVTYDPSNGTYSINSGSLTDAIDALDQAIEEAQEDIITTQTKIDLYEEYGFTGANLTDTPDENNCLAIIDQQIEDKTAEIELLTAEVERIQTTMQKLLDAYTSGSTETPAE